MRMKSQQRKVSTENKNGQQEQSATQINDYQAKEEIRIREQTNKNFGGKILQAFKMLMFIAYPNIMQFMLNIFKCIEIEGEMRLKADLEILCWSTHHHLITFFVALPSLIVWGVGLPILAFVQLTNKRAEIISAKSPDIKETYGFIFGGLKTDFYFWELVITFRKLILIAVCIFVTNFGVLAQALITLLVLVLFLVLTARKRPFISEPLFDLEALSISTAIITVYCGLFYLADTSQMGLSNFDKSSDVTFAMGKDSRTFLLSSIIGVNSIYFVYWLYRVFSEMDALRGLILKTFPSIYLMIFACGDKDQAYLDQQKNKVLYDNEGYKEELMRILQNVKQLYNRGDLLLNEEVMRKLRNHMKPEKVLQVAGFVDQNDSNLNEIIQQRLKDQRQELSVDETHIYQERSVGSLLVDGPVETVQDQLRYLRALKALKQDQGKNLIDEDDLYISQLLNEHQGFDTVGALVKDEFGSGENIHQIAQSQQENLHQSLHAKRNSKTPESPFTSYIESGYKDKNKPPGSADALLQQQNGIRRIGQKQGPSDFRIVDEVQSKKIQDGKIMQGESSQRNNLLNQPIVNGFISSSKEAESVDNQGIGQSESSKQVGTFN